MKKLLALGVLSGVIILALRKYQNNEVVKAWKNN